MEQHVLVDYELDPETIEELTSGRTGGWLGRYRRPAVARGFGWRTFVRPIWPLLLMICVVLAGVRAASTVPAAMWAPMAFDLLRLCAVALPIAAVIAYTLRRTRRRR